LLFWGSASAPYHVGIYVGNNQYIYAEKEQITTIIIMKRKK
ncbi:NlpC/P60 family protein, partial [Lactococcus lactis]